LLQLVSDIYDAVPEDVQVLGIADTTEHLDNLVPFLRPKNVRFVHAETSQDNLRKKRQHNLPAVSPKTRNWIYKQLEAGELKRAASTGIYRQGVDFPELQVILNLAGLGSSIAAHQLPGRASRTKEGKAYGVLVDFWHPYDVGTDQKPGFLHKDDKKREQVYRELGFQQLWPQQAEGLELLQCLST